MAQVYIAIAIASLAVVAIVVFTKKGAPGQRLSPLAGVSFALVVAGIVFGEDRVLGYGLMGAGVLLALYDALLKRRQ
ncbi:MAG TPA: hypothetical protein VFJ45_06980 [bacterium]|nr:hypothetical protein [bacterium]